MPEKSKDPLDAELEREIEEALGETSLLGVPGSPRPAGKPPPIRSLPGDEGRRPARGKGDRDRDEGALREGTVVGVGKDEVFVEFGPKEQGIVPLIQFPENPSVGAKIKVRVDGFDAKENLILCSLTRTVQRSVAMDAIQPGSLVNGTVRAVNKGGLELQVGVLTAFLPASHVALERIEDLTQEIGKTYPVEVVEVDREKRRIVVSRRGILGREREERRANAVKTLAPGTIVTGKVTKVEAYGAFVDLGGIEGLLHVSQLAWKRIEKPEEVVKAGDAVKVQILEVSEDGKRISLGMKQLTEDPWLAFTRAHPPGTVLEGTVTRIAPYGAFVEIAEGVEGLAHVSQLAPTQVHHAKEVVKPGEKRTVRIVNVDPEKRRVGLSLLTERGDRLTDDVADDKTIQEVLDRTRRVQEPTLGDLLKKAMEGKGR